MSSKKILTYMFGILIIIFGYLYKNYFEDNNVSYGYENIPEYNGKEYVILNNNVPYFKVSDYDLNNSFEKYSDLDYLGRATVSIANIGSDIMPSEKRESIGMIKPTGWHTIKYDFIDGKYLYNRCHLIGFQLTGENANEKNLITCTRQMNIGIMLDYENNIANYVKNSNNHVLYRVSAVYKNDNLLASGVIMEGYSVEDNGNSIMFNIYIYNVQEKIEIDYKTGDNKLKE